MKREQNLLAGYRGAEDRTGRAVELKPVSGNPDAANVRCIGPFLKLSSDKIGCGGYPYRFDALALLDGAVVRSFSQRPEPERERLNDATSVTRDERTRRKCP